MEGLGRAFRVLRQTLVEPRREMVQESCSSQSGGVPGGSNDSSAPTLPQLCAVGVLGWGAQVMLAAR